MTPAIEPNEIVTAMRFPLWPAGHKAALVEFSRRHGDFAIVSAAALLQIDGGKVSRASVTVGGGAVAPVRAAEVEQAITGQAPTSELFAKACESCRSFEALADIHASADYRQHLAAVLSRRALEKAAGIAENAPWNRAQWDAPARRPSRCLAARWHRRSLQIPRVLNPQRLSSDFSAAHRSPTRRTSCGRSMQV